MDTLVDLIGDIKKVVLRQVDGIQRQQRVIVHLFPQVLGFRQIDLVGNLHMIVAGRQPPYGNTCLLRAKRIIGEGFDVVWLW